MEIYIIGENSPMIWPCENWIHFPILVFVLWCTQWRKSCSTFYYWFKTGSFSTNTEEDVSVYGLNLSTVELVAQFSPQVFFLLTTQFMIRLLASAWYACHHKNQKRQFPHRVWREVLCLQTYVFQSQQQKIKETTVVKINSCVGNLLVIFLTSH